jgi:hypothetical protein
LVCWLAGREVVHVAVNKVEANVGWNLWRPALLFVIVIVIVIVIVKAIRCFLGFAGIDLSQLGVVRPPL